MLKRIAIVFMTMVFLFAAPMKAYAYQSQLKPFIDVKQTDWAKESIYSLSALGIIKGYEDLSYRPGGKLTREAWIRLLVETAKLPDLQIKKKLNLDDVAETRWSAPAIRIADQHGLLDFIIQDGRLSPAKEITRAEVAALLGQYLGNQLTENERNDWKTSGWMTEMQRRQFGDQAALPAELRADIYLATSYDLIVGDDQGYFRPNDSLTRREAAAILYRMIDQQVAHTDLDVLGFYAIRSYSAINQMNLLDEVAMGWSNLEYTQEGMAKLNTTSSVHVIPQGWEEVVEKAADYNIPSTLMVFYDKSDLPEFLRDDQAQDAFINSLLETLDDEKYGFSGVLIDFEGLRHAASQSDFVQFLHKLDQSIGTKTLTVAVPPTEYFKGYDLQGIGEIADQVVLMAYDFTHMESGLPSAPLPLVNETVEEALQYIPREKLILGISKQANQWITDESTGLKSKTSPLSDMVEQRLLKPGVTSKVHVPFFLTQIEYREDGKSHEIWYEDQQAIAKKIWLAKYYGLKGISLWYMGHFTESDWIVIRK